MRFAVVGTPGDRRATLFGAACRSYGLSEPHGFPTMSSHSSSARRTSRAPRNPARSARKSASIPGRAASRRSACSEATRKRVSSTVVIAVDQHPTTPPVHLPNPPAAAASVHPLTAQSFSISTRLLRRSTFRNHPGPRR